MCRLAQRHAPGLIEVKWRRTAVLYLVCLCQPVALLKLGQHRYTQRWAIALQSPECLVKRDCQLRPAVTKFPVGNGLDRAGAQTLLVGRSEEHTSELQSLMRISYAVLCLKKKKSNIHRTRSTPDP